MAIDNALAYLHGRPLDGAESVSHADHAAQLAGELIELAMNVEYEDAVRLKAAMTACLVIATHQLVLLPPLPAEMSEYVRPA
jgi:hypothetical protein